MRQRPGPRKKAAILGSLAIPIWYMGNEKKHFTPDKILFMITIGDGLHQTGPVGVLRIKLMSMLEKGGYKKSPGQIGSGLGDIMALSAAKQLRLWTGQTWWDKRENSQKLPTRGG